MEKRLLSSDELRKYMYDHKWSYEAEQEVLRYLIKSKIAKQIDVINHSFMFCNVPVWSLPESYQSVCFVLDGHVTYR